MPDSFIIDASDIDPIVDDWREIDDRENSSMVSCWTERLCMCPASAEVALAICINGSIGEDTRNHYCEDDEVEGGEEPLPAFCDGQLVAMAEDGQLCGPLIVASDDAYVELPAVDRCAIASALNSLEWTSSEELIDRVIQVAARMPQVSTLDPDLVDAYLATIYQAEVDGKAIELRIGSASAELHALCGRLRQSTATFITAWNPYGKALPSKENARRHRALLADAVSLGLPAYTGEGRGLSGDWPPEASLLVIGLSFEQAIHLGRHHEQNAIVWADHAATPALILLR